MDATKTTINSNSIGVHALGISVSLNVSGVGKAFGLLRKGAHKAAAAAERKLADKATE